MRWPTPEEISKKINIPQDFVLDTVSVSEVEKLSGLLRQWYPDVSVGMESSHLNPQFFINEVTLKESIEEKSIYAFVFRYKDEIAAFMSVERNEQARTIYGKLCIVSPFYRKFKLATTVLTIVGAIGEYSGAALVWTSATIKSPFSQRACEAAGFKPVGIMPAYDLDQVEPGKIRHVYEIIYAKVIVSPGDIEIPKKENMTESVRLLWELLFEKKG